MVECMRAITAEKPSSNFNIKQDTKPDLQKQNYELNHTEFEFNAQIKCIWWGRFMRKEFGGYLIQFLQLFFFYDKRYYYYVRRNVYSP